MSAVPRIQHVPEYRLRPDDLIDFIYRLTRDETREPYELNVGDEIRIESFTDKNLDRSLIIQPDGTITLPLLGQVRATRHTVAQLREDLETRFQKVLQGAVDCGDADTRQHETRRSAGGDRRPVGIWTAGPARQGHARRRGGAAGRRHRARPRV